MSGELGDRGSPGVAGVPGRKRRGTEAIRALLITMAMVSVASLCQADRSDPSEDGLIDRAYECCAKRQYQKAATILEGLISGSDNEEAYWKLAEIYDNNLYDYVKAYGVYRKYLALFPSGRFYPGFHERLRYLQKNKSDWAILKRYRMILATYYQREAIVSIAMMNDLLKGDPRSSLAPDIYFWLACEYHQTKQYGSALEYIKKYIATFPSNGKPLNDKIEAYQTYAVILTRIHMYGKAMAVLDDSLADTRIDPSIHWKLSQTIRKERRIWTGFVVSVACMLLGLASVIALRPWRRGSLKIRWSFLAISFALLVIGTLLPMIIVRLRGYGLYRTFPSLLIFASAAGVLIEMLAPVQARIGRRAYLLAALVLTLAGIYISFYLWDALSVFYQLPDF